MIVGGAMPKREVVGVDQDVHRQIDQQRMGDVYPDDRG